MLRAVRCAAIAVATFAFAPGSPAATSAEIVADVCPGACSGVNPEDWRRFAAGTTKFYFVGYDEAGPQPWVADRTGARRLASIRPVGAPDVNHLMTVGDTLFFVARTPASSTTEEGYRLWRSDGTAAGTAAVEMPGRPSSVFPDWGVTVAGRSIVLAGQGGVWWVPAQGGTPLIVATDFLIGATGIAGGYSYIATASCLAYCGAGGVATLHRLDESGRAEVVTTYPVDYLYEEGFQPWTALSVIPSGVFVQARNTFWFSNGRDALGLVRTLPANRSVFQYGFATTGRDVMMFGIRDGARYDVWGSDGSATGTLTLASFEFQQGGMGFYGHVGDNVLVRAPQVRPYPSPFPDAPRYQKDPDLWVLDPSTARGARPIRSMGSTEDWTSGCRGQKLPRGIMFCGTYPGAPESTVWFTDGTTGGTVPLDVARIGDFIDFYGYADDALYFSRYGGAAVGYELFRLQLAPNDPPARPTVDVTEYRHAGLDHYFLTADDREKARLDAGETAGWVRTGHSFVAYAAGTGAPNTTPVCRFYGRPEAGLDSHFYSAVPAECAAVEARFAAAWIKESANVFEVIAIDPATGRCREPGALVYRAFNQRADANHRYSMSVAEQAAMRDQGWIAEGATSAGIVMCVPLALQPPTTSKYN